MNIIYRKNTLYVYIRENIDDNLISKVEDRVNNIMGIYNIDNLIIRVDGQNITNLKEFGNKYKGIHDLKSSASEIF